MSKAMIDRVRSCMQDVELFGKLIEHDTYWSYEGYSIWIYRNRDLQIEDVGFTVSFRCLHVHFEDIKKIYKYAEQLGFKVHSWEYEYEDEKNHFLMVYLRCRG